MYFLTKTFKLFELSNPLAMNVFDEGYLNYATCALHEISTFLLQLFHVYVSYILDY
jgi:hypothetical protein